MSPAPPPFFLETALELWLWCPASPRAQASGTQQLSLSLSPLQLRKQKHAACSRFLCLQSNRGRGVHHVCLVRIKTRYLERVRPGAALCPCLLHVYFPPFLPHTEQAADPAVQRQVGWGEARVRARLHCPVSWVYLSLSLSPTCPPHAPSQRTVTPVSLGDASLRPCPPEPGHRSGARHQTGPP